MSGPNRIRLLPCPFCGGPPVPIVTRAIVGGTFAISDDVQLFHGIEADATVFCHECGADCGRVEDTVHSQADVERLERIAVHRWQNRSLQNLTLFVSSYADGLNQYPRPDRDPPANIPQDAEYPPGRETDAT